MKHSPFRLDTGTIHLLAALIIGLFIIFPDVVRNMEEDQRPGDHFEQLRVPPGEDFPMSEDHEFGPMPDEPIKLFPQFALSKNIYEFLYFFVLALVLLYLNDGRTFKFRIFNTSSKNQLALSIFITLVICISAQYLHTLIERLSGPGGGPKFGFFNGMVMFKCFFVGIISVLFSQLIQVLFKQQMINLEMERLKSENLRNRFDALTSQINPHFFFNSLNALSGLVRTKDNSNALKYINELSRIFRYVLKGNWKELVLLEEEMSFLEAYQYLLEIRYNKRLDFKITLSQADLNTYRLPYLSLQPLIENVIKHNTISSTQPMTISIFIKDHKNLVVSNPLQHKIEVETGTGIGLSNLNNRYKLLTNQDINTYISHHLFVVELPLTPVNL